MGGQRLCATVVGCLAILFGDSVTSSSKAKLGVVNVTEDTGVSNLADKPWCWSRIGIANRINPVVRLSDIDVFREVFERWPSFSRSKYKGASLVLVSEGEGMKVGDAWLCFWKDSGGWPVTKKSFQIVWSRKRDCWVTIFSFEPLDTAAQKAMSDDVANYRWTLPIIPHLKIEVGEDAVLIPSLKPVGHKIYKNVGPIQGREGDFSGSGLNAGLLTRVEPEPTGGNVQPSGYNGQNSGESNQKRVSHLHSVAEERRPELGSLFASLLAIFGGMIGGGQAWRFRQRWKLLLCFSFGALMILDGTVGFLFGLDAWSIYRWWSLG